MMFPVLLLLLALCIVREAGQNTTVGTPAGVVSGGANTTVFSRDNEISFKFNLSVIVNGAGGHMHNPMGALRPPGTIKPTQGIGIPSSQPSTDLPVSPAGKGLEPSGPHARSPGTSFEQDGFGGGLGFDSPRVKSGRQKSKKFHRVPLPQREPPVSTINTVKKAKILSKKRHHKH